MSRSLRLLGLLAIFGLLAVIGPASSSSATSSTGGQDYLAGRVVPSTPIVSNLPDSAVYGDGGFTATVATNGDGTTSVTSSTTDVCTVSGMAVTYVAAGTCTLTAHVAEGANYEAADGGEQFLVIDPAQLTITARDQQKIVHFPVDLGTTAFTVSGLVGSDTISSVTLTSAGAVAEAADGSYAIVPSAAVGGVGTDLDNYAIHYVDGTLGVLNAGIVGLDKLSLVPFLGKVDSFDSSLGPFSDTNHGDAALALSNGTVSVGDLLFAGDVMSTQGNVRLTTRYAIVTGGITAGTTVTNPGGHIGLAVTENRPSPAIAAPTVPQCSPFSKSDWLMGRNRWFTYSQRTGDLQVNKGTVRIADGTYCFHNIHVSADARLMVTGPVTIYLTGKWFSPTGKILNMTDSPSGLVINSSYGGPSGVTMQGGPHAYMTVVAPRTGMTLVKGTFSGRILAGTVKVSGHGTKIHQDVH